VTPTCPTDLPAPCRLRIDGEALAANWRLLSRLSGVAACGAAVKADGYGLGAVEVVRRLADAGCRDFFVATWEEAAALQSLGVPVSVLHGVRAEDMSAATAGFARPVLNTLAQVARWRQAGAGRPCDVMVDTGMNRLGLSTDEVRSGLLDGLEIDVLMSHLACADEDSSMNARQRGAFAALAGRTGARRLSLSNSAGVALGPDYAFDLTRPGIALYGARPRSGLDGIAQVVFPEAQVLQCRGVRAGEPVGYNATWRATGETKVAILNVGYADGYRRAFSNVGSVTWQGTMLPLVGRVSMDLTTVDATAVPSLAEGDWVTLNYDLTDAAASSGISAYELLTGLGRRAPRLWI